MVFRTNILSMLVLSFLFIYHCCLLQCYGTHLCRRTFDLESLNPFLNQNTATPPIWICIEVLLWPHRYLNCFSEPWWLPIVIFSERELTFTFAICYGTFVCLSVACRLSVTFVRPTQAVEIFGNISAALGTLAIHWHPSNFLRRSSQGNPYAGGVEHKRGSKI